MVSTLKIWCSGIVFLSALYMCHAAATAVSDTACPLGSECSIIPNSACDTTTTKCRCNPGHKQDTTNTSICIAVFGTACSTNTDCPSDSHTNCSGSKCLCLQNFVNNSGICTNATTNNANAQQNPVAVSSTTCKQVGDCKVPHSECNTSAQLCKCSDGFVASTPGGESCVNVAVSSTTCKQVGDCKVPNSECDTSAQLCKCSDGFVASTPGGESCVNVAVSSTTCKQAGDCKVPHSECDTSAQLCKCSDGFVASTPGGESCVNAPVSSAACTKNTDCKVGNSECDATAKQCACLEGFKQSTSGTCDKESAAVTAHLSTLSIGVSMTLFLFIYKRY